MKFFVTGVGDQLVHDVMNELSRVFRKNSTIHRSYAAPVFVRKIVISPLSSRPCGNALRLNSPPCHAVSVPLKK